MLLIGSRATALQFADFRVAADWDLVVSASEADALATRLPEVATTSTHKRLFRYGGRPLECSLARDADVWSVLHATGTSRGVDLPLVGHVRVAEPSWLLAFKLSHVHLDCHWRKTVEDLTFLEGHGVSLDRTAAELLPPLRGWAERHVATKYPDLRGLRVCPAGVSSLHARLHAGSARTSIENGCATALPAHRAEAAEWLAEEAAVGVAEELLAHGVEVKAARFDELAWNAIWRTVTKHASRELRIAFAPASKEARKLVTREKVFDLVAASRRSDAAFATASPSPSASRLYAKYGAALRA